MPKVVPDDNNRFRKTWDEAREQGIDRQVMSDALGIDRGRLNDLILGRARPRLGEMAALTGRRRSSLIRYRDTADQQHSFYTGRGMSFERLVETGAIVELADEMSETNRYLDFERVGAIENRSPGNPNTNIYPTSRTLREQLGGMRTYEQEAPTTRRLPPGWNPDDPF